MPLTLGGDFAAQHLSTGQILAELLNIVRDNASKLDRINSELEILKEQVTSLNTERKNAQLIPLHTTSPIKDKIYINSSSQTDQQACVKTSTPKSQQDSTKTTLQMSKNASLKTTVSKIQQTSVSTSTPTVQQASADTALPVTKLNKIRELVEEYNSHRDWRELKAGLTLVLDKNSKAYEQLGYFRPGILSVCSPYDVSCRDYVELAMVLLEAGLEVDSADDNSARTMLHGSAQAGNKALAQFLLDHGANVNLPDDHGDTALIYASKYGHMTVVKLLVERGADVNAVGKHKYTSLHYAAQRGRSAIVQYLVEAGANTKAKAFYGIRPYTPLDLAKQGVHNRVVAYLSQFND